MAAALSSSDAMAKRDTKDLQGEIEKSRTELNALQKKIKSIIEKRPAREALVKEIQEHLKQGAAKPKSK
jgi:hypothetical protein